VKRPFFLQIEKPEDVVPGLAKGALHWKAGSSAYELAHRWIGAGGIPDTVRKVLDTCSPFSSAEITEGVFERKVNLRSPGTDSQTDLMALVRVRGDYAVIAVEGKVKESFGPLVGEWKKNTRRWQPRLEALCRVLGLNGQGCDDLRYQLLHRTASALFEAEERACPMAMMLVHSFCPEDSSLSDFLEFARRMGMPMSGANEVSPPKRCGDVEIRLAWVRDTPLAR